MFYLMRLSGRGMEEACCICSTDCSARFALTEPLRMHPLSDPALPPGLFRLVGAVCDDCAWSPREAVVRAGQSPLDSVLRGWPGRLGLWEIGKLQHQATWMFLPEDAIVLPGHVDVVPPVIPVFKEGKWIRVYYELAAWVDE